MAITKQLELEKASLPNMLPGQPYDRFGDKQNSDFFEEYLLKIYDWRDKTGLTANFGRMSAVVVEVDPGLAKDYIAELSVMTMYSYVRSFEFGDYRYHLLRICPDVPDMLVRESLSAGFDLIRAMSEFAVKAKEKPRTRYIGEIYEAHDYAQIFAELTKFDARFVEAPSSLKSGNYVYWTEPSIYTWNAFGYRKPVKTGTYPEYDLDREFKFSEEELSLFAKMKSLQKELNVDKYILPYDHLATRVYSHDREHAILELMRMSCYYYWGSFNIDDQNSSTNVTRPVHDFGFGQIQHHDEYGNAIILNKEAMSPAKVFTANNTPYYVNDFVNLPQPTEAFVRNFGRRMHHLAVSVRDGYFEEGQAIDGNSYLLNGVGELADDHKRTYKYVDFVVDQLRKAEKQFLADVVGSCEEGLKQIFSKASEYSFLITEYIQRCNEYAGFFTKNNVAALTAAAGMDESVQKTAETQYAQSFKEA